MQDLGQWSPTHSRTHQDAARTSLSLHSGVSFCVPYFVVPLCALFFEASPRTGSILFLFLFFLFFPMDGGVKVAGRPALNPRALRELLPNCWRVVAAMEKVLGSGRSNWNTNGSAVTAASGYRSSPSILNASLNTWYT